MNSLSVPVEVLVSKTLSRTISPWEIYGVLNGDNTCLIGSFRWSDTQDGGLWVSMYSGEDVDRQYKHYLQCYLFVAEKKLRDGMTFDISPAAFEVLCT